MSRTRKIGSKWFNPKSWNWFQRCFFKSQHSSRCKQYIQRTENRKNRREEKQFLDNIARGEETPEPIEKKNVDFLMW